MVPNAGSDSVASRSLEELGLSCARAADMRVTGICQQSAQVERGHLFAAISGENVHGAKYAAEALQRGAAAILTDREGAAIVTADGADIGARLIIVDEPRKALAELAANWFARAPETAVAVTGTNGKSSIVGMCRQIWGMLGKSAVSVGTMGVEGDYSAPLRHTTPDPVQLFALLAELHDSGITHMAIEASSHGLAQHRLDGLRLAAAAFSNLSHDHLDYHGSMEAYFTAKAALFERILPPSGRAVIWIDSPAGQRMALLAKRRGLAVTTLGAGDADIRITAQNLESGGQNLKLAWNGRILHARLALPGEFQARNALTAAALAVASGEDVSEVVESIEGIKTIRGRLELAATRRIGTPVYVDYAHTPDALATVMKALRRHYLGRLIVVFGAGGERDTTKRAPMGEAVSKYSDVAVVTDDNPRNEKPEAIRADILRACPGGIEIPDRAEAILRAVDMLEPGDVLLIAGKGHETGQQVGDIVHPFNDVEQASMAVKALDGLGT